MSAFKSDFLRIMSERGFIHQTSDDAGLDQLFARETVSAYIGFDATARSLHAGSLIQIMMLHWLQQTGHRPIALMGGGTSMIGDPSFKDEARKLLTPQDIEDNLAGIRRNFMPYLKFGSGPNDAIMINNADWLMEINYVNFLRDVGRHFSVNRMLAFDSVKLRLDREQSLSFLEFNYMILQAYDFVELYKRLGCRLQMGGSDQWGNIVNGIDLGHRMENAQLYALTTPLLTTSSGAKMGKSASGAVWLDAKMLSPYEFWQYWRNTEDADVGRFLKLYTTLSLDEIARLEQLGGSEINEAKKILATEITAMLHSREAAEKASETARKTFEEGALAETLPTVEVDKADLEVGVGILSLFVTAGLAASNGEARRHIQGGAVRLNDEPVTDDRRMVTLQDVGPETILKLSLGKKKHILVRPV
ncbi:MULTISPECIES: tyrosine--tRNA ligase [unclassified Mesorhizobium]|uniref:tyrosine--tRNA ligase n=1 Tax=unclassified Mesorhizobium TaxID=325217 RepID=UPI000FD99268|nr:MULTISPECIES: tyrosine--tRNA ligase [unclassified Mesorhizobium]TGQ48014.1 tyrosine--tRNA ligase [Mesorhizobium sp. M00.F.Ca.ET.216.01.1.1]TIS53694.1 MAG: tyrosine--tRNA ligase [Mesorhizobium sp.]TIS87007.1 MAG: tyrosine--tRNA ligase [Mesorhizobium sp.]TJW17713.1 MAG: tyrosine--tRNA ligase [Mesorhizobium sp.]TJW42907.1 MAG: tyrosine--tRNA ligase [Mesorhizobium sp.]